MAPELRTDPLWGHSVIMAPDRFERPGAFPPSPELTDDARTCPFCQGREHETPPALAEFPLPGGHAWQVRVIPNRYPATCDDSRGVMACPRDLWPPGVFATTPALGRHEVIIESPEHVSSFLDLRPEERELSFQVYAERLRVWRADPRLRFGMLFKNQGLGSGASLTHVHSQMLGLETIPEGPRMAWERQREHYAAHHRCLMCEILNLESVRGERTIWEDDNYVVFCPFASRVPFEVCLAPRKHASHFELEDASPKSRLAPAVSEILARLAKSLPDLTFNFILHSAPFDIPLKDHYHWHMTILPRRTRQAGWEWATGCMINPLLPERAAELLRSAGSERSVPSGKMDPDD
ncbi:MAG TPA: hypothetical protein VIY86_00790 [Pirellulaceae bacterium]